MNDCVGQTSQARLSLLTTCQTELGQAVSRHRHVPHVPPKSVEIGPPARLADRPNEKEG